MRVIKMYYCPECRNCFYKLGLVQYFRNPCVDCSKRTAYELGKIINKNEKEKFKNERKE